MTPAVSRRIFSASIWLSLFGGLFLASRYSYLLFHSLAEIFSVIVAVGIFAFSWNARRFGDSSYFVFLGTAYLQVGFLDLLHTLAYKGMGVFPGYGANLPTQLWIAARYLESLSLLSATVLVARPANNYRILFGYLAVTTLLLLSIFYWDLFPDCYVEPSGLTSFKIVSEYAIALILIIAIGWLFTRRSNLSERLFRLVVASILATIAAELLFTFYISVYGLSNFIGHLLKIVSFYLIYRAIIEIGMREPYLVMFRNLKRSETDLRREKRKLEAALAQIKTLSGLIPICANCKNIRDDQGYWNQLESYIQKHSDATFSHGICPECVAKLYPEFAAKPSTPGSHK